MSIFCIFFPCRWLWFINVPTAGVRYGLTHLVGLYQCQRCKTISQGAVRDVYSTPTAVNYVDMAKVT